MVVRGPGEFRQEATVEKAAVTRNDDGSVSHNWVAQSPDPIRCKIERLRGEELVQAQAMASNATLKVSLYYFAGLEPKNYRFLFGIRELNILFVDDTEERQWLMEVLCGETL